MWPMINFAAILNMEHDDIINVSCYALANPFWKVISTMLIKYWNIS